MGGMGPGGGNFPKPEPKRDRTRLPSFAPATTIPIHDIQIIGNTRVPNERITAMLHSRVGRYYDPETVQRDVRSLMGSGMFQNVKTYKNDIDGGKSITFEVFERPVVQYVRFVGNDGINDEKLLKDLALKPGDPLNGFSVEETRRSLQQVYRDKGYADAHIEIIEGTQPKDKGVVFQVHEGGVQRIYKVDFVGNTIASDARLKTQIKSKPGILWLFGGKVRRDQIGQDVERLTAYYRRLGYFRARVGRKVEYNADRDWVTLTFVIDEGARYRVRNITAEGNENLEIAQILSEVQSQPGEFFNLDRMRTDLNTVRDLYGSQGYIFSKIEAEPRFQEKPGVLDIVFKINEGEQYRVGRILVNIDGENPHTRQSVVLNRISIRPGEVIDIRKLRASEMRLQRSSLFLHDPASGVSPKITVRPPREDETQIASAGGDTIRGQGPHVTYRPSGANLIDVIVTGTLNPAQPQNAQPSGPQSAKPSPQQPPQTTVQPQPQSYRFNPLRSLRRGQR